MPRQLLARGQMKVTTSERISVVVSKSEGVDKLLQLKLSPVVRDDGGEYRCVYNSQVNGLEYKIVILNVQGELLSFKVICAKLLFLKVQQKLKKKRFRILRE